jgi:hypothetical protein
VDRFNYSYTKKKNIVDWIPILSLILAIASVLANIVIAQINNKVTKEVKEFEITFEQKRKLFSKHIEILSELERESSLIDFNLSLKLQPNLVLIGNSKGMRFRDSLKDKSEIISIYERTSKNFKELKSNSVELFPFIKDYREQLNNHTEDLEAIFNNTLMRYPFESSSRKLLTPDDSVQYVDLIYRNKNIEKKTKDYYQFLTDSLYKKLFPD